jgi:hypothetical protein
MKKIMGRPKIGIQNAKGIIIAARFSPPEVKEIDGAVKRSNVNRSAWVRKSLLSSARDGIVKT